MLCDRRVLFGSILLVIPSTPTPAQSPDSIAQSRLANSSSVSQPQQAGDVADVYRSVLDLFFFDGDESPPMVLLHDTAEPPSGGGPCPAGCDRTWPHKSQIDASTIFAFGTLRRARTHLEPFAYRLPVTLLSWSDAARMRAEGDARLQREHPGRGYMGDELLSELVRVYPGAWGKLRLSGVGLNTAHTQALVQASFLCGVMCNSDEVLFLRKLGAHWTVIERIPNSAEGGLPYPGMRYRGPAVQNPGESEIVASSGRPTADPAKIEGREAARVYRTVLDSLYHFQGDSPRRVVTTDWWPIQSHDPPPNVRATLQPSTLERFRFFKEVRAPAYATLHLRAPVSTLYSDSVPALERLGAPLAKLIDNSREYTESTPFWLAFRQKYPGAWGTVGFTRVAFNNQLTQAILITHHACGIVCYNYDTWILDRSGEEWRVSKRIPGERDNHWALDSLRYLGLDADPRAYQPRRVHGRLVVAATGRPLSNTMAIAAAGSRTDTLKTDVAGRFSVDKVPIVGWTVLFVPCPGQPNRQPLLVAQIESRPGLDSTLDVPVDYRRCVRQKRARPLIAGRVSPQALASTYPSAEVAAVYRAVFDTLYPDGNRAKGPILIQPFTYRICDWCVDHELPRLIHQGIVDSSTASNFLKIPKDSAWFHPPFEYRRKVVILSPAEQKFLIDQAEDVGGYDKTDASLLSLAKDAYPGADSIWALTRVAFNDAANQAIVQVGTSAEYWIHGQTMLLQRSSVGWRVVRRHLERGETSGAIVGGRCEPVDAPSNNPTLAELEDFGGDAYITTVGTSGQLRSFSNTMHLRFVKTDTLHRYYWLPVWPGDKRKPFKWKNQQKLATVEIVNDSTGKSRTGIAGEFELRGKTATISFFEDKEGILDGWFEQYKIMKVDGSRFFGNWFTESGPTIPFRGYFCGIRRGPGTL